jgi:oligopeptide/dipeptide ABC transporter ATP-binding protein
MTGDPLLSVQDLRVSFDTLPSRRSVARTVRAVDGIDLAVRAGETLGLVGESGCGKSSAGLAILGLVPFEGAVRLEGRDIAGTSGAELRRLRRRMQVIFQDPFSSLNPRHTIGQILREPLDVHRVGPRAHRAGAAVEMLERVGLEASAAGRYPHEFSGGQRQRVAIARALMLNPSFIVCDEPTSALDVSTQAQIVTLLEDLQAERGIAYLFIAHDLAVVRHISDWVAVMYLGRIVELSDAERLYSHPRHPYTRSLIDAAPIPDPVLERARPRVALRADTPESDEIDDPPSGCRFRTRCPFATERCATEAPALRPLDDGHVVACHHAERIADDLEAAIS